MNSREPFETLGAAVNRVVSALLDRRYAGAASAVDANKRGRLIGMDTDSPASCARAKVMNTRARDSVIGALDESDDSGADHGAGMQADEE